MFEVSLLGLLQPNRGPNVKGAQNLPKSIHLGRLPCFSVLIIPLVGWMGWHGKEKRKKIYLLFIYHLNSCISFELPNWKSNLIFLFEQQLLLNQL